MLMILIKSAPATEGQNPVTSNPFTTEPTSQRMKPFIIRVKSPRVKIFIGRVRIIRMGLMRALKIPRKAPATKAGAIP